VTITSVNRVVGAYEYLYDRTAQLCPSTMGDFVGYGFGWGIRFGVVPLIYQVTLPFSA